MNKISISRGLLISDNNLWVEFKKDINHVFIIDLIFYNYKNCQYILSHRDKYKLSSLLW